MAQLTQQRAEINYITQEDELNLIRLYNEGKISVGTILIRPCNIKELITDVRDRKDALLGGIWTTWQERRDYGVIAARNQYQLCKADFYYQGQNKQSRSYFSGNYFGKSNDEAINNSLVQRLKEAGLWEEAR